MELNLSRPESNLEEKKGAHTMSSIYTQLTESDLQVEKEISTLLPSPSAPVVLKPKLTGIKLSIFGAFAVAVAALLGVIYVYESLLLEAKQRRSLESSHAALSERAVAFEAAVEEQKNLVIQLRDRVNQTQRRDDAVRLEIRREIEKRRTEIIDLQTKLKTFEAKQTESFTAVPPAIIPITPADPASAAVQTEVTQVKETPKVSSVPATPGVGPVMPPSVGKQRVLTVNRQFKFVVINSGTEEGAKIGDRFSVARDGKTVGTLQIEKLYDNFAAATILEENQNVPIEVGDSIVKSV